MSCAKPHHSVVIKRVGVFGNPLKDKIAETAGTIRDFCSSKNVDTVASLVLQDVLPDDYPLLSNEDLVKTCDVVIALGGDGTMLLAARVLGLTGVPLLGVNMGSLGYLTDVPLGELEDSLELLLKGDFHLDTRARVYCSVWREGKKIAVANALNDLVVNMGPLPRAIDLELIMDGNSLGRFLGDGVIFATPTGSTAYNLSAGGAICHPDVPCLLVSPICPHSLGIRPLIVSKDTKLELILHETGEGAVLTADGQTTTLLANGDRISFKEAFDEVNLVKFTNSDFYRVMRHKLDWGGPLRRFRRSK